MSFLILARDFGFFRLSPDIFKPFLGTLVTNIINSHVLCNMVLVGILIFSYVIIIVI